MNRMERVLSSSPDGNKKARSFTKVNPLKWHQMNASRRLTRDLKMQMKTQR